MCGIIRDVELPSTLEQVNIPETDLKMVVDGTITIGVQVNGKLRGTIELPKDCHNETAEKEALSLETVKNFIGSKNIRKIIVVPNRIINVVI